LSSAFASSGTVAASRAATYLAARSDKHGPGSRWSDFGDRWRQSDKGRKDRGLVEFCQQYEIAPNDQLQLIWLLDYFRPHPRDRGAVAIAPRRLQSNHGECRGAWPVEGTLTGEELETASLTWQAYRANTPEACFNLLRRDLNALPLLKPANA
jgi:hypothetical protein